ncbi:MAG: ABC transporter permease [Candidatus Hermodarchaeota archaeon]
MNPVIDFLMALLPDSEVLVDVFQRIVVSMILLAILVILSFWQKIQMEKSFVVSVIRGIIQIVIMALFLIVIFALQQLLVLYGVMLFMCLFAAFTANQRMKYPGMFGLLLFTITISGLSIMTLVIAIGIIPSIGEFIIPMGGMVISNVMVILLISLERLSADIEKSKGKIEAALALGDTPRNAVKPILRDSFRAALMPSTNRVAVLGIVTIPGLMAGMIIGGAEPLVAAIYQVIIFLMLMAGGLIGSVIGAHLFLNRLFTKEDQLDLVMLANTNKK